MTEVGWTSKLASYGFCSLVFVCQPDSNINNNRSSVLMVLGCFYYFDSCYRSVEHTSSFDQLLGLGLGCHVTPYSVCDVFEELKGSFWSYHNIRRFYLMFCYVFSEQKNGPAAQAWRWNARTWSGKILVVDTYQSS